MGCRGGADDDDDDGVFDDERIDGCGYGQKNWTSTTLSVRIDARYHVHVHLQRPATWKSQRCGEGGRGAREKEEPITKKEFFFLISPV